jgi:hypothetical protein
VVDLTRRAYALTLAFFLGIRLRPSSHPEAWWQPSFLPDALGRFPSLLDYRPDAHPLSAAGGQEVTHRRMPVRLPLNWPTKSCFSLTITAPFGRLFSRGVSTRPGRPGVPPLRLLRQALYIALVGAGGSAFLVQWRARPGQPLDISLYCATSAPHSGPDSIRALPEIGDRNSSSAEDQGRKVLWHFLRPRR